ncbi:metal-dependent transcriptional regulator [Lactobacillus sp. LC28-10]|uniref:Manganese transport regulator n=1 Tax=Secundilactobacillus angelensis TaxID=2722706 RepID=A0ABX1L3C5_9LACO|nr:metal-dependent transcriptional regulator [Secundilactobacillus angelensis]MCH5462783.1 metal-dependent transcriptional regulator [Secundilactobacillus angelensis]NLR19553.1 metal-dependent transcriptional regulator [Secundilactobacillus angelensis]
MTPMKEDYLKIIFELGGASEKVSNKQIAISLNIAAGSVTEMINKMVEEGLVNHEPYAGISLTDAGRKKAVTLVRKHRLWETFLVKKLGFALPDLDVEAERLEHVTSEKLANAMDDALDHPKKCPHGGTIPDRNGHYDSESHLILNDVKDGQTVTVTRFIDNHDLLTYLGDIKLDIGDKLQVNKHDPFEGPVLVTNLTDKQDLTIGYKAAHYIFVE